MASSMKTADHDEHNGHCKTNGHHSCNSKSLHRFSFLKSEMGDCLPLGRRTPTNRPYGSQTWVQATKWPARLSSKTGISDLQDSTAREQRG